MANNLEDMSLDSQLIVYNSSVDLTDKTPQKLTRGTTIQALGDLLLGGGTDGQYLKTDSNGNVGWDSVSEFTPFVPDYPLQYPTALLATGDGNYGFNALYLPLPRIYSTDRGKVVRVGDDNLPFWDTDNAFGGVGLPHEVLTRTGSTGVYDYRFQDIYREFLPQIGFNNGAGISPAYREGSYYHNNRQITYVGVFQHNQALPLRNKLVPETGGTLQTLGTYFWNFPEPFGSPRNNQTNDGFGGEEHRNSIQYTKMNWSGNVINVNAGWLQAGGTIGHWTEFDTIGNFVKSGLIITGRMKQNFQVGGASYADRGFLVSFDGDDTATIAANNYVRFQMTYTTIDYASDSY